MAKKLTEQEAKDKIADVIKSLKESRNINIEFLGFVNDKWTGVETTLILKQNEQIWSTTSFHNFIVSGGIFKTRKYTKQYAIDEVLRKINSIKSEQGVDIEFLGFIGDEWIGNKTKLILKCGNRVWDTTGFNQFMISGTSGTKRSKLTEKEAREEVERICKNISTEDEEIKFLGWVGGVYKRNTTKLILYNSKLDLTWTSTSFNNFQKNKITFPKHGLPKDKKHLTRNTSRKTTEEFISQMKQLYPDKNYDYSKVVYEGGHRKVCIICHEIDPITGEEHGEFWSDPANLLNGSNCPKCSNHYQYTTEEFIKRASVVHNGRYSYEKTEYIDSKTKVCVTCPEHGDFLTNPTEHITKKYGCPGCGCISRGEEDIIEYLRKNNIFYVDQYSINASEIPGCPNKYKLFVDFYLEYKGRRIFIEFNGEQHYIYSPHFQRTFSEFGDQVKRDRSLEKYARDNGYELFVIPYVDLPRIPEILDAFLENSEDITTKITKYTFRGIYPDIDIDKFDPDNPFS